MNTHITKLSNNNPKFYIVLMLDEKDDDISPLLKSIKEQTHANWQLLFFYQEKGQEIESLVLEELAIEPLSIEQVSREKCIFIKVFEQSLTEKCNEYINKEISEKSLLLFVDADTCLSPYALSCLITPYQQQKPFKLCYGDHNMIDKNGNYSNPVFKPDFDYYMLLSFYYFSMVVYDSHFFKQLGGFKVSGINDCLWDLALRATEACLPQSIKHIPIILSHHNKKKSSLANNTTHHFLFKHLQRCNIPVEKISFIQNLRAKIHYKKLPAEPLVSIIIPTKNGYKILKQCIDSLFNKTNYSNFELIIVDNQSDDIQTIAYLDDLSKRGVAKILKYNNPFNYSAINNLAVAQSKGSILLFMNNDIEVINKNWLIEMINLVQQDRVGAVGAKLLYPDNTIQHAGVILGLFGVAGHIFSAQAPSLKLPLQRLQIVQQYSAVTAACLAVKKTDFVSVSGFNEQHLSVAFNDVDFCLKLQQYGLINLWTPFAQLYHHESISRGSEDTQEKRQRFEKEVNYMKQTWKDILSKDPFYNINLSLEHLDFSPAEKPRLFFSQ